MTIAKIFPDYFERFEMPKGAREESITVYRACKNGRCDADAFIPTFEENGYQPDPNLAENDPGQYSLSTYEKPKDVKRFAGVMYDVKEPCCIAVGKTNPIHGLVQRTKERTGGKTSHVDWWLYEKATPHIEFKEIQNFKKYLEDYKKGRIK